MSFATCSHVNEYNSDTHKHIHINSVCVCVCVCVCVRERECVRKSGGFHSVVLDCLFQR